jgi:hypothetical protein
MIERAQPRVSGPCRQQRFETDERSVARKVMAAGGRTGARAEVVAIRVEKGTSQGYEARWDDGQLMGGTIDRYRLHTADSSWLDDILRKQHAEIRRYEACECASRGHLQVG